MRLRKTYQPQRPTYRCAGQSAGPLLGTWDRFASSARLPGSLRICLLWAKATRGSCLIVASIRSPGLTCPHSIAPLLKSRTKLHGAFLGVGAVIRRVTDSEAERGITFGCMTGRLTTWRCEHSILGLETPRFASCPSIEHARRILPPYFADARRV